MHCLAPAPTALSEEVYAIVYLDGFHLKVRMAKRVISLPVLVALGVAPDGQKRLLSLRLAVSEASTHWGSVLEGLQARGLRAPKLVISDGHKGLTKALEKWPGCRLQQTIGYSGRSTKAGASTPATPRASPPRCAHSRSALNEGRGINPGDTGRHPRPSAVRHDSLNEGRGINPVLCQNSALLK